MRVVLLISLFLVQAVGAAAADQIYRRTLKLMGSRFDITVVAPGKTEGEEAIDLAVAEISRIEKLISSWDEHSQTAQVNRQAGLAPVEVDADLFQLVNRALYLSKLTDGAFDITYASMDKIWKFDGSVTTMPDADVIANSVARVGYQKVVLDNRAQSIYLREKGMKIGFGAIGKGFAADKARKLLMNHGVKSGIINASGDMHAWGKQPDGMPWRVGITNPMNHDKIISWFNLENQSVVTSGNYEKFVMLDGKRYTHIIDPRTGMPACGLVSVTVFAPAAELADALATSVFVMGKNAGLDLVNQLKGIEAILIDEEGAIFFSENIQVNRNNETD